MGLFPFQMVVTNWNDPPRRKTNRVTGIHEGLEDVVPFISSASRWLLLMYTPKKIVYLHEARLIPFIAISWPYACVQRSNLKTPLSCEFWSPSPSIFSNQKKTSLRSLGNKFKMSIAPLWVRLKTSLAMFYTEACSGNCVHPIFVEVFVEDKVSFWGFENEVPQETRGFLAR